MAETGCLIDGHFQNVEVSNNLLVNQDDFTLSSSTTSKPVFTLENSNNGGTSSILKFNNTEAGGAGADDDVLGQIEFHGQDNGSATEHFAAITGVAEAVAATSEQGRINFGVSVVGDGEIDSVLTLCGASATAPSVLSSNPKVLGTMQTGGSGGCSFLTGGYTIDTGAGAQNISAAELIGGYVYNGAAGGGAANLTLPGADAVQTALATVGVTTAAGLCMPPIIIEVTDGNNLTVTAGNGETMLGDVVVNDHAAVAYYVFTAAATATCIVIGGAA